MNRPAIVVARVVSVVAAEQQLSTTATSPAVAVSIIVTIAFAIIILSNTRMMTCSIASSPMAHQLAPSPTSKPATLQTATAIATIATAAGTNAIATHNEQRRRHGQGRQQPQQQQPPPQHEHMQRLDVNGCRQDSNYTRASRAMKARIASCIV